MIQLGYQYTKGGAKMTAKEVAEKSKMPLWKVYYVARKLGRLPSVDEIVNWKQKVGRPLKYTTKE